MNNENADNILNTLENVNSVQPAEQLVEQHTEQPTEQLTKQLVEQHTEQPTEQPAEQHTEQPAEQHTEQPAEQHTEQPTEQPAEQNISADDFVNYLNSLWSSENQFTRTLNDIVLDNNISNDILKNFKKIIEDKYNSIKVIGNFNYTNKLEKEVRLKKNELNKDDIKNTYIAYRDLLYHGKINNVTMNKINKVYISEKLKDTNKDKNDVKNYRFIQVHSKPLKLIDRLWCLRVYGLIKNLDTSIFKSNLLKGMTDSTINVADENTKSIDNVILIDIEKAFDSCDYSIIEDLLKSSLQRKSNETIATHLTKQYMYILRERELYFKEKKINYHKGLPTGFPSSNMVFSLVMDEIIHRWRNETEGMFEIGKDFKLNIYVDDIYIKLLNVSIKDPLVITLIDTLHNYKFKVNFEKCKADEKLKLEFFTNLCETDMYLGIPFTRDIKKYSDLLLKRYGNNETYKSIYDKLKQETHPDKKQIFGFFNYKLKPLMKEIDLIQFIEKNLI
jgi:hypothetical protein